MIPLQEGIRRDDTNGMGRHLETNELAVALGENLAHRRAAIGLSPQGLAQACGLKKRQVLRFERAQALPSDDELVALADALRTSTDELAPPGYHVVLVGDADKPARTGAAALDALLREYLSMLMELRNAETIPLSTVRHDDLSELAAALGGTPEAIEAKIATLLDTDTAGAEALRTAIFQANVPPVGADTRFGVGATG